MYILCFSTFQEGSRERQRVWQHSKPNTKAVSPLQMVVVVGTGSPIATRSLSLCHLISVYFATSSVCLSVCLSLWYIGSPFCRRISLSPGLSLPHGLSSHRPLLHKVFLCHRNFFSVAKSLCHLVSLPPGSPSATVYVSVLGIPATGFFCYRILLCHQVPLPLGLSATGSPSATVFFSVTMMSLCRRVCGGRSQSASAGQRSSTNQSRPTLAISSCVSTMFIKEHEILCVHCALPSSITSALDPTRLTSQLMTIETLSPALCFSAHTNNYFYIYMMSLL